MRLSAVLSSSLNNPPPQTFRRLPGPTHRVVLLEMVQMQHVLLQLRQRLRQRPVLVIPRKHAAITQKKKTKKIIGLRRGMRANVCESDEIHGSMRVALHYSTAPDKVDKLPGTRQDLVGLLIHIDPRLGAQDAVYLRAQAGACVYVCVCVCVCVHMQVCACWCMCVHACVYASLRPRPLHPPLFFW